jgi:1,5-anhydro-D-fructose reductase (1,5-anhydro-D-mannitol-forming)
MVRFGIVGFGLHAVRRLMPGFALAKNCQVTALSRRNQTQAQEAAKRYKIAQVFASTADLCRSPEVDAVLVTTPNSAHLHDVLTSVEAGKPVLCEKPMGMSAAECRRMVEAARQSKVLLGVAHVFRFEESVGRLRERVAAGEIGVPAFARSEFSFRAGPGHGRTWIYDPNIAGGGPIADIGVHCIDSLRYILQDEVVRVSTRAISHPQVPAIEVAAALTLEFSRGTLGTVLCSFITDYRSPLELVGDSGTLCADDCLNVEKPVLLELRRPGATVETDTVSNRLAYALQADAFAAAVEGKAEFPVPGEEGWQNQEILDAAYRSIQSGQAEAVPRVR